MAVRYIQSGQADEAGFLLTGGQVDDDSDDGWWAGTQRCFARVALAAALAASTFTAAVASEVQQDLEEIPAHSLLNFPSPDEDYWQNPVAPIAPSIYQQLPYCRLDPEELPAHTLLNFISPDEDFWENPVNPIPTANYIRLPYLPEPEEVPAGKLLNFVSPDEDFWENPLNPIATTNFLPPPYLPDTEEIPAGLLRGQPDEDYWQNPVAPTPPSIYQPLPILPDLSDDPAASLYAPAEEFFWQNPVAPVPPTVYQRLPYQPDPEEIPAGALVKFISPDEDYWSPYAAASGDGQPYVAQLLQASMALYQRLPYLFDPTDDPAGWLRGPMDEDFWANPVAPIAPNIYRCLPYLPELSDDPAGSLYGQADEDYWGLGAGYWGLAKPPTVGINPQSLIPSPQTLYLPEPEEVSAGSLCGQPDEDFWQNPVAPVPLTIFQTLPIASGEVAEIVSQVEEEYWQNPVAPVPPSVYQRLPYLPELSDDPAGSLYGQPDEDYWGNGIALPTFCKAEAPPRPYLPQPYLPDPEEIPAGALHGQAEEEFWQNPVPPVPPSIYQRLPYLPELSDDPAGSLLKFISPDEDYWQQAQIAQIAQMPLALYQPLPIAAGEPAEVIPPVVFQPDEDYWGLGAGYWGPAKPPSLGINPQSLVPAPQTLYLPDPSDESPSISVPDEGESQLIVPARARRILSFFGSGFSGFSLPPVMLEEDYWLNPVSPTPATISQPLPYLPDVEEPATGTLYGTFEDDSWTSPVNPTSPAFFQRLPYLPDPEELAPASLYGQPDEDYWGPGAGYWGLAKAPSVGINPQSLVPSPQTLYLPDPSDEPGQFHLIEVDWYAESNAVSTTGYNIYRGTNGPGSEGSTPINAAPVCVGAAPDSLCTYLDTNIQWGVTYWYAIYAYDISTQTQNPTPSEEVSGSYPPVLPDDDYWGLGAGYWGLAKPPTVGINPQSLVPSAQTLYLPDSEELPAGALQGQPDEDFWANPVAPVPASIYQRLPILDFSDEPAGSFYGQPDEDYWANGIALPTFCRAEAPPRPYLPQPYLPDPEEMPAGALHGQPDEDPWINPVAPVPPAIYQPLPIAAGEVGEFVSQVEEEYWQNPVAPLPATIYQRLPYLPEVSDDPAASLRILAEETEWVSLVAPVPLSIFQPLPYLPDLSDEPAGALYGFVSPDEDYWGLGAGYWGLAKPPTTGISPQSLTPAPQTLYFPDLSDEPAGSLLKFSSPDEDYWGLGPIPVGNWKLETGNWMRGSTAQFQFSNFQFLPYLPDLSDDPAGALLAFISPDEDYWALGPGSCGSGKPAIVGVNPQSLVPSPQSLYLPDLSDEPAGLLRILAEEAEWANWIAPVAPSVFQALPYASGLEDFESYWRISPWGIRTHSAARRRMSRSQARVRITRGASRQGPA